MPSTTSISTLSEDAAPTEGTFFAPSSDESLQILSPVEGVALYVLHSPVCKKQRLPRNVVPFCYGDRNLRNLLARNVHVAHSTAKWPFNSIPPPLESVSSYLKAAFRF